MEKQIGAQRGVLFRVQASKWKQLFQHTSFSLSSEGLLFSHLETSYDDRKIVGVLFENVGHVP